MYLFDIEITTPSVGGTNVLPTGKDLAKMSYEDFGEQL